MHPCAALLLVVDELKPGLASDPLQIDQPSLDHGLAQWVEETFKLPKLLFLLLI